jgi:hypothetical protein
MILRGGEPVRRNTDIRHNFDLPVDSAPLTLTLTNLSACHLFAKKSPLARVQRQRRGGSVGWFCRTGRWGVGKSAIAEIMARTAKRATVHLRTDSPLGQGRFILSPDRATHL